MKYKIYLCAIAMVFGFILLLVCPVIAATKEVDKPGAKAVQASVDVPKDIGEDLVEAVKLNPRLVSDTYRSIAVSYINAGKPDEALLSYEKLNKFSGDQADALCRMADIYQSQGKPQEAEKTYQRLIKATPNIIENYYPLIEFYRNAGQKDRALDVLKTAETANAGNKDILARIAELREKIKEGPKAAAKPPAEKPKAKAKDKKSNERDKKMQDVLSLIKK